MLLAALPIDRVEPTPFQRDPSPAHVKRLMDVIEALRPLPRSDRRGSPWRRILDAERESPASGAAQAGRQDRRGAPRPDSDVAFKILALNTEKAHNLKEKSLETIRMERALAGHGGREDGAGRSRSSSISRRS